MALTVGAQAPDVVFYGVDGRDVRLSDLWRRAPVVFLFLRHFGCPFFRRQLDDVARHYDAIRSRGAEVLGIGQGTTEEMMQFCEAAAVPFPVVGDPTKTSYGAYGLGRGTFRHIFLDPIPNGIQTLWRGYRFDLRGTFMPHSDWFQLPGVAIVDRDGVIRYLHRGTHPGDIPPAADLLATLLVITTDA